MTTLAELVDIVRQSRERTDSVFPLPDVDSCIDYAITEAGEYLDAVLRDKRDTDKRNRDKDHDARNEYGQCGYMIASALIQMRPMGSTLDVDTLAGEFYAIFSLLAGFRNDAISDTSIIYALGEWSAFAMQRGENPAELLRETCAAFEAKHLPVVRGYDFELIRKAE